MGAIENIRQLDAAYHQRCDSIDLRLQDGRPKLNNGECWWPGCDKAAQSLGLCRYHLAKHHSSTLLRVDRWAFPVDEIATLYRDVVAFADSAGITPDEAVTWLIAEGLNSYERRAK